MIDAIDELFSTFILSFAPSDSGADSGTEDEVNPRGPAGYNHLHGVLFDPTGELRAKVGLSPLLLSPTR